MKTIRVVAAVINKGSKGRRKNDDIRNAARIW